MPYALAGCRTRRSKVDPAGQHCLPEAATAPPARRPPGCRRRGRDRGPLLLHTYAPAGRNRYTHTPLPAETARFTATLRR